MSPDGVDMGHVEIFVLGNTACSRSGAASLFHNLENFGTCHCYSSIICIVRERYYMFRYSQRTTERRVLQDSLGITVPLSLSS
jgi:hypothetical protein